MRFRVTLAAVLCAVVLAAACKGRGDANGVADSGTAALPEGHIPLTRTMPLPADAQAVLDSANAAYGAKDYTGALALYGRTLVRAPGHPAPWFGISMAANMLGDSALADSAQRVLQRQGASSSTHPIPAPAMVNPHRPVPKAE